MPIDMPHANKEVPHNHIANRNLRRSAYGTQLPVCTAEVARRVRRQLAEQCSVNIACDAPELASRFESPTRNTIVVHRALCTLICKENQMKRKIYSPE